MSQNLKPYNWKSRFMLPSKIDSYVYHRNSEQDVETFVMELLKLTPFPKKAEAGVAFHDYIEKFGYGDLPLNFTSKGWDIIINNINITIPYPFAREVKFSKNWNDINIFAVVDGIDAYGIHDIKTTSKLNVEKYMESWQWKIYLWITEMQTFIYDIFTVDINEIDNILTLKNYDRIELKRYPNMVNDIDNIFNEYSNYLDTIKPVFESIIDKHKLKDIF